MDELERRYEIYRALVCMPADTKQELISRVGVIADAYVGSANKDILNQYKDSLQVILSSNVVNYIKYINSTGELNRLIASNPKVAELFNSKSSYSLNQLIRDLKVSGWNLPDTSTIDDVSEAIATWGIETVVGDIGDNAEAIDSDTDGIDGIDFDGLFDEEEDEGAKGITDGQGDEYTLDLEQQEQLAQGQQEVVIQDIQDEAAEVDQEQFSQANAEQQQVLEDTSSEMDSIDPETQRTLELLAEVESQIPLVPEPDYEDVPPEDKNASAEYQENRKAIIKRNEKLSEAYGDAVAERQASIDRRVSNKLDTERKQKEAQIAAEELRALQFDKDIGAEVNNVAKSIMDVYDSMYQPLFSSTSLGVLSDKGIIAPTKADANGVRKIEPVGTAFECADRRDLFREINAAYGNAIRTADHTKDVSIKECFNGTELVYNCMPRWHALNINGLYTGKDGKLKQEKNWKRFRPILFRSVLKAVGDIFKDKLEKAKKAQERVTPNDKDAIEIAGINAIRSVRPKILELFTTAIIIEQFDDKALMFMASALYCNGVDFSRLSKALERALDQDNWPRGKIDIKDTTTLGNGVFSQVIIRDSAAFDGEILFAYKAIEKIIDGGGSIGLQNTLIGRDVITNRNITYNFASPQAISNLIIAGSGSGKGVLTLNILATAIAEGCPTVYLDWKPDMAAMLWDLERKMNNPDVKILAIDGLSGKQAKTGSVPVRNHGTGDNRPECLKNDTAHSIGASSIYTQLNVIPYVKALQLMVICALARSSGKFGMSGSGKKMLFILDEAQQMNMALSSLKGAINDFLNEKENKPAKGQPYSDAYTYVTKLKEVIKLYDGMNDVLRTTGRTGYVGMIILGQAGDAASWATGSLKRDALGSMVGNCSMKLLGKGAINNTKYELNGARDKLPIKDAMGYYALVNGSVAPSNGVGIKVAKTYLTLNYNDYSLDGTEGPFTSDLLKNITDDKIKNSIIENDFINTDQATGESYINQRVGFAGLMEYIGSNLGSDFDLGTNLSLGYREVEHLLDSLGILDMYADAMTGAKGTVEDYLFDCSLDSLFTIGELKTATNDETTVVSSPIDPGMQEMGEDGDDIGSNTIGTFEMDEPDEPSTPINQSQQGQQSQQFDNGPAFGGQQPSAGSSMKIDAETLRRINNIRNVVGQPIEQSPEQAKPVTQQPFSEFNQENIPQDTFQYGQDQDDVNQDVQVDEFFNMDSDASDDQPFDINQHQAEPGEMRPNPHQTFQTGGANNRCVYATPESTSEVVGLTRNNSILVTMPPYTTAERFHSTLFKTVWGTQYEFKNRWNLILNAAASSQKPLTVTRLIILEDQVIFNKKAVATIGLLGGDEDIRLEDIVNFTMTAKKYKNIKDLLIDTTILETAQIELGDPFSKLFQLFPNLMRLTIMSAGSGSIQAVKTRAEYEAGTESGEISYAKDRAVFKNQFEAMAAARNPNLRNKRPGYQNKCWQTTKQNASSSWSAAQRALRDNNPKYLKAAGFTLGTLTVLAVGGVGSILGRIGSLIRRR